MNKIVMDAYAWLEYFNGSEKGKTVQKLINEAKSVETHAVTVAEVVSCARRKGMDADAVYAAMRTVSRVITTGDLFSKNVGILHAEIRSKMPDFGLADAFVMLLAKEGKAKIVTGDPHFRNRKEVIFLE